MAIRKALWKENVEHPAVNDRRLLHQLWGGREGRMSSSDFLVGDLVGLGYNIYPGRLVAKNDLTDGKDFYFVENDANFPVTHNPGNGSNPRNDLVCIKVADSDLTGSSDTDTIVVLEGSPAQNPIDPVIPTDATYIPLWNVRVGTSVQALSAGNFTSRLPPVAALMGTVVSVANPTDRDTRITPYAYKGMQVWREDISRVETWVGSVWVLDVRHDTSGDVGISRDLWVGRNATISGTLAGPTITALSGLIEQGGLRYYGGDLNLVTLADTPVGIWICSTNANASYGTLISFKSAQGQAIQFAITYGVGDSNSPYWCVASARTFYHANTGVWGPWWKMA